METESPLVKTGESPEMRSDTCSENEIASFNDFRGSMGEHKLKEEWVEVVRRTSKELP